MEYTYLPGQFIYLIKSISGISINKSFADEKGLANDRRWMLIDENSLFITQRKNHEMALIKLKIHECPLVD